VRALSVISVNANSSLERVMICPIAGIIASVILAHLFRIN